MIASGGFFDLDCAKDRQKAARFIFAGVGTFGASERWQGSFEKAEGLPSSRSAGTSQYFF